MIKRLFLLVFAVSIFLPGMAEKVKVDMKTQQKHQNQSPILRDPVVLSMEVLYDAEARIVETLCASPLEGTVTMYDAFGVMEAYSPCLNSVISLTESDYHTIVIEGDDWIATGVIE